MKALLVTLNLFKFCRWSSSARRNFLELKCCKSLEWIFRSSGKNLHSHVSNCILTPNVKENLCKSFNVSLLSVNINRGENLTMSFSMLTFYHLHRKVQKSDIFYIWTYLNKMIKKESPIPWQLLFSRWDRNYYCYIFSQFITLNLLKFWKTISIVIFVLIIDFKRFFPDGKRRAVLSIYRTCQRFT